MRSGGWAHLDGSSGAAVWVISLELHWWAQAHLVLQACKCQATRGFSHFSYTYFCFHMPTLPCFISLSPSPQQPKPKIEEKKKKRKKYSVHRKVRASPCSLLWFVIISTGTALHTLHNAFTHALIWSLSSVRQVSLPTWMVKMRLREVKKLDQRHTARLPRSWHQSPGVWVCNRSGL